MQSSPRLADHIRNALIRPFHKGVPRIEARKYISFYEEDESRSDTLLKFAKIDFSRVQLIHRQELSILTFYYHAYWRFRFILSHMKGIIKLFLLHSFFISYFL